jgi:thiopurine S-methyltransferase
MRPGFWYERWEQGQIGFHQREVNRHLQQFWDRLPISEEGDVFIPLCGKSLDLLWLRAQGHRVMGVEISPIAVRDFFRDNRLNPAISQQGPFKRYDADGLTILLGDFFDLTPNDLEQVCGVYDRASLVALPAEMRLDYARHFNSILPAGISSLLVSMEYEPREMAGPPFAVHEAEIYQLFAKRYQITLLLTLNILAENPQFVRRGVSALQEKVYLLADNPG